MGAYHHAWLIGLKYRQKFQLHLGEIEAHAWVPLLFYEKIMSSNCRSVAGLCETHTHSAHTHLTRREGSKQSEGCSVTLIPSIFF